MLAEQTEKYDILDKKRNTVGEELQQMKRMVKDGILLVPIWHEQHSEFVSYWLGFNSYSEFMIYHKCLWPDVDTIVHIKDGFEDGLVSQSLSRAL